MFASRVSKPKAKTASADATIPNRATPFQERAEGAGRASLGPSWNFSTVPIFSEAAAEGEADRVAAQVVGMAVPDASAAVPSRKAATGAEGASEIPGIVHDALRSGGQPLDPSSRTFFEPRFGQDFGQVRIHVGTAASAAAAMVKARAFTVGSDIAFGVGEYRPSTAAGRQLLAHELTHVMQQRQAVQPKLQRQPLPKKKVPSLADYDDADPKHDPSLLTDAQIMATVEYKDFATKTYAPRKGPVPQNVALLAARLMLRTMRELVSGPMLPPVSFLEQAEKQAGALAETEKQVGHLKWKPFSTQAAVMNPSALPTDFGRWVLAGGPMPDKMSGAVNCWEMVLFGAHKAGYITFARIKQIYEKAVDNVKTGKASLVGDTVESMLQGTAEQIFDPANPDSPAPLPGDLVIFKTAATHVAIATGTIKGGKHEVISLWTQPGNISTVQRTTIEDLLSVTGPGGKPVKFWSPRW